MVYIYILELQENKFYVGKTNNPTFRLEQHFNESGALFTKIFKPLKLLELIPNCDDYDEDKYTLKYMSKYGIENVRGGSFCQLKLSSEHRNTINRMLAGTENKCYKCGGLDHFVKDCKNLEESKILKIAKLELFRYSDFVLLYFETGKDFSTPTVDVWKILQRSLFDTKIGRINFYKYFSKYYDIQTINKIHCYIGLRPNMKGQKFL
jgi:predicted GIY-YIG superfamily endonuclease